MPRHHAALVTAVAAVAAISAIHAAVAAVPAAVAAPALVTAPALVAAVATVAATVAAAFFRPLRGPESPGLPPLHHRERHRRRRERQGRGGAALDSAGVRLLGHRAPADHPGGLQPQGRPQGAQWDVDRRLDRVGGWQRVATPRARRDHALR